MNSPSKAEGATADPHASHASKAPRATLDAQKVSGKSPLEMPFGQIV